MPHRHSCLPLLFFVHDPFFFLSLSSQTQSPTPTPSNPPRCFFYFFPNREEFSHILCHSGMSHYLEAVKTEERAGTLDSRTSWVGSQLLQPPLDVCTNISEPAQVPENPPFSQPPEHHHSDPRRHVFPTLTYRTRWEEASDVD